MVLPTDVESDKVILSFNQAAKHYQSHARLQQQIGESLVRRLEYLILQPQCIVDVGCGTGHLLPLLHQLYPNAQLYGIDIAVKMLQEAVKICPIAQFFEADAKQLPLADHSVDLLISNLMLQWCNDVTAIFAEFARVLTPEGTLLFSTFGPDTLQELRMSWAKVDDANHVNEFIDMHHLGDSLLHTGLRSPVMDVDRLTLSYPDVMDLLHELKMIGAHNITTGRPKNLMGKSKFQAFKNAYETLRTEQGLPVTYEVIYGYALGNRPMPTDVGVSIDNLRRRLP